MFYWPRRWKKVVAQSKCAKLASINCSTWRTVAKKKLKLGFGNLINELSWKSNSWAIWVMLSPKVRLPGSQLQSRLSLTEWGPTLNPSCFKLNESVGTLEFESVFTGVTCKLWEWWDWVGLADGRWEPDWDWPPFCDPARPWPAEPASTGGQGRTWADMGRGDNNSDAMRDRSHRRGQGGREIHGASVPWIL